MKEDSFDQFMSDNVDRLESEKLNKSFTTRVMSIIKYEQVMATQLDNSQQWQKIAFLVTGFSVLAMINTGIAWYFGVFDYLWTYFEPYMMQVDPKWVKYGAATAVIYILGTRVVLSIPFLFRMRM